MRKLMVIALVLASCGEEETRGPVEAACHEVAETYCCGLSGGELEECMLNVRGAACNYIGSAPEAGCANGGSCIRSSVDFGVCMAALDELGDGLCKNTCAIRFFPGCIYLPDECESIECYTADVGCAEDD